MVAHSKNHKPARRKEVNRHARKHQGRSRLSAPPPLPSPRPPVQEEELPKDDEEPKPEDLAKEEEALKAQEPAETVVVAEAEEPANARTRERTSYDGDTAIKLYLREIGQV